MRGMKGGGIRDRASEPKRVRVSERQTIIYRPSVRERRSQRRWGEEIAYTVILSFTLLLPSRDKPLLRLLLPKVPEMTIRCATYYLFTFPRELLERRGLLTRGKVQ